MLLDVQNRRPFEVEVIVGEVVRMAHERGVEIPVSDHLDWLMTILIQTLPAHRAHVFDVAGDSKPAAGWQKVIGWNDKVSKFQMSMLRESIFMSKDATMDGCACCIRMFVGSEPVHKKVYQ